MRKLKVHIEDPKEPKKTLCGKVEKYLDKRKLADFADINPHEVCRFCANLHLRGTNRGDLH